MPRPAEEHDLSSGEVEELLQRYGLPANTNRDVLLRVLSSLGVESRAGRLSPPAPAPRSVLPASGGEAAFRPHTKEREWQTSGDELRAAEVSARTNATPQVARP